MSFCIKCGRELKEGESCNCQGQVQTQSSVNLKRTVVGKEQRGQDTSAQANKTKLMIIVGSIVMCIACFMPFFKVTLFGASASAPYTDGDGVIVIILAIIAALLAGFRLQKFSLIPTIIALFLTLYDVAHISERSEGLGSPAIGAYLVIIGSVIAIAGGIFTYVWGKK